MRRKIKRKTPIKCYRCKKVVIGYKHPTSDPFFDALVKHNENTSRNILTWVGNSGEHYSGMFCLECESAIREEKRRRLESN